MHELTFNSRPDFRRWLEQYHDKEDSLWLIYYKKKTGIASISYEEAVEEALCFGWIDSKVQSMDEMRYKQIFTPRKIRSAWSETNKLRVKNLLEAGLMKPAGMKAIEDAKKSGRWQKSVSNTSTNDLSEELKNALMQSQQAWENFNNFASSYRSTYITWVNMAKRTETVQKRIEKVVEYSLKNLKPGMM